MVPLTSWKNKHDNIIWLVPVEPTIRNGLNKKSVADLLQTRCVSVERFESKVGFVSIEIIQEIVAALASITEYV